TIVNNHDKLTDNAVNDLLHKAYDNANRLCSLLRDISVITRISEAGDKIEKTPVNISNIIADVKEAVSLYPPEKRMRVNID
ncbi:hypothetical protein ABTK14_23670, partial [Acinetobacter baumannii]